MSENAPVKWAAEPSPQSQNQTEPPLHLNDLFCSDSSITAHDLFRRLLTEGLGEKFRSQVSWFDDLAMEAFWIDEYFLEEGDQVPNGLTLDQYNAAVEKKFLAGVADELLKTESLQAGVTWLSQIIQDSSRNGNLPVPQIPRGLFEW